MDVVDIALSKGIAQTEVKKLEGKILDKNGQIQSSLLPNYTEIPIEYETREDFPLLGETGYIYVDKSTGRRYKWSGSTYIEIVADLILGETEFSAYRGDRGKIAYDHSQTEGNPHNTTTTQIGAVPKGRTINGKTLENDIEINASDVGALSDKTTINGKLLKDNISLTAEDVGALSKDADIPSLENYATKEYVDKTVTDKNTELSNTIGAQIKTVSDKVDSFDGALEGKIDASEVDEKLSQLENKIPTDYVPSSRTINGKALETDISFNAQDIGAEQAGAAEQMLQNAKSYTDEKDELISSQISQYQEGVNTKISSIEQDIVNQEEQISNIGEAQTLINTTLNENKQKIQENSNKIQENLSAINTNSQKIEENTAAIEENSSQISQHKEEVNGKISSVEQSLAAQDSEIETVKGDLTSHTTSSNSQFGLVREEFATQDAETLKTAKEYSDANKESAVSSAKGYTDQKINELVTGTGLAGVVDTIADINEAMAKSSDMMEALEAANSKKVDKGAKGSTIKPIYFDENGAQEIAYSINKDVPADAKFTDTTYTLIKDATNKKILLMSGDKEVSQVDDNNTTYTIDGSLSTSSTNPIQNKVVAENINNLQENIDANASEIEEINSKDLFETKHEEGNVIAVSDSAEAPFVGMKLYGKTTQNGTPTPSAPVPLVSVGDSGSSDVGVYGKQLLNVTANTQTIKGITYTINDDKSISISGAPTDTTSWKNLTVSTWFYLPNGKYTLTCSGYKDLSKCFPTMYYKTESGNKDLATLVNSSGTTTFEITTGKNNVYLIIGCNPTYTPQGERLYISIFPESVTDLSYEKCTKQTLTMPYTLASAKNNVRSEIDLIKGKVTELAHKEVFDGSDDEKWETLSNGRVSITVDSVYAPNGNDLYNPGNILCSVANIYSWATLENATNGCAVGSTASRKIGFKIIGHTESVDAWKSYLASNPITVVYELATPIETPLTETELNAYRQLHTNKPNTTILSEADMEVDYVVNSTSAEYIENRLEEVKDEIPTKTSQLTNDSSFVNQTGLNNALNDKLSFDEEVINSTSDVSKIVPEGSGKYATVNKVGGMSYKCKNLFDSVEVGVTGTLGKFNFLAGIQYTISLIATSTVSGNYPCIIVRNPSGTQEGQITNYGNSTLITTQKSVLTVKFDTNTEWNILAQAYNATSSSTTAGTFKAQVEIGTEATNYEPYYSGIRNTEVTNITSTGKNLFKINEAAFTTVAGKTFVRKGITYTLNEDKSVTINGTATDLSQFRFIEAPFIPKGRYILSGYPTNVTSMFFYYFKTPESGWVNYVGEVELNYTKDTEGFMLLSIAKGAVIDNLTIYPMLRRIESIDNTYEPYKESVLEIPRNVITTMGYGLGIDENCYNYIDWERKVFVKRCVKLTGFIKNFAKETVQTWTIARPENVLHDGGGICSYTDKYRYVDDETVHWYVGKGSIWIYAAKDYDASSEEVIVPLTTPEEIDISNYLPDDNFIEVATGGVITAVNEYNYDAPTEISFYTSESPEKAMVADTFVGDLVGIAEEAQSLVGLDSTIEELNYLHKGTVTKEGWFIPEEGAAAVGSLCGAPGVIGFKIGNTYTLTITYKDGSIETDNVTAIDSADWDYDAGAVILQGNVSESITVVDKANIDSELNITVGTNHYWYPPSLVDEEIKSILVTGTKSDDTALTHVEEAYNKIPEGHLPDKVSVDPPIKQYWEWTSDDTNSMENNLGFEKPDGYNRCRILIYDRKFTSDGALGIKMPVIWPMARDRNSETSWFDMEAVGRPLADVTLGKGEGENQTTGGTEWVSTVSIDVYFTDKGFMCNYVCSTEALSTKTVAAGSGYPETYAGQIGAVLSKDASVDSVLVSSLVWTLGIFPQKNKGNYVEVTWYKD